MQCRSPFKYLLHLVHVKKKKCIRFLSCQTHGASHSHYLVLRRNILSSHCVTSEAIVLSLICL